MEASSSSRNLPAAPTNGRALLVFVEAGAFADEHDLGVRAADAGDGVSPGVAEAAVLADVDLRVKGL